MPRFTTRDIGLAVRDHLEDHTVTHFVGVEDGDLDERGQGEVRFVDVSDPNNLVVHTDNGQTFTLRIIAGARS